MTREKTHCSDIWDNFPDPQILDSTIEKLALSDDCAATLRNAQQILLGDPAATEAELLSAKALFAQQEEAAVTHLRQVAQHIKFYKL